MATIKAAKALTLSFAERPIQAAPQGCAVKRGTWGKGEPSTFILVISGKVKIRNPDLPSLKGGKSFILRSKLDLRV